MESTRNLKLGVIFSYITMIAGIVVSMTYTPFLLRSLGTQQYGLYNMGQAAVSYLGLTEFGFGNAIVRYASKYRAEGNEEKTAGMYGMFMYIYSLLAVIIILIGTFICIFSNKIFSVSTGEEGYFQLRVIIAIMVINLALTFVMQPYSSIITSYEKFTFIKVTNLIYTLSKPIVMIPLLIWGYKAVALSVVTLILTQLMNLANVIYVRRVLHVKISMHLKAIDFSILREIVSYSFFIFLGAIVSQLNDNTDNVILGIISGEAAVAVYAVGYQLNTYIQQIPGIISSVFFPRVTTRITQGATMDQMTDLSIRVGRLQFYVCFLLCSGFTLFGKEFLNLWVGNEYVLSYWIVLVLIIPAVIPNIQQIPVVIITAMNRHQFKAILYVVCAVLNVVFSIPAGMKSGPLGCAACTGITTFLTKGLIINWFYSSKIHLEIGRFWKNILSLMVKLLPLILVGIGLNFLITTETWLWLFVKIVVFTSIFGIYALVFCMNSEEKQLVFGLLRKA